MYIKTNQIIYDPNPLLRTKCEDVSLPLSSEDEKLALGLYEYVLKSQDEDLAKKYNLKNAVGLAAPQIGVLKNMLAVVTEDNNKKHHYALVNPKIVSASMRQSYLLSGEGCLSIDDPHPGYVIRHWKIKVKAYDALSKQEVVLQLKDFPAIVVQHEIDHLNGVLFYDRINKNNPFLKIPNAVEI